MESKSSLICFSSVSQGVKSFKVTSKLVMDGHRILGSMNLEWATVDQRSRQDTPFCTWKRMSSEKFSTTTLQLCLKVSPYLSQSQRKACLIFVWVYWMYLHNQSCEMRSGWSSCCWILVCGRATCASLLVCTLCIWLLVTNFARCLSVYNQIHNILKHTQYIKMLQNQISQYNIVYCNNLQMDWQLPLQSILKVVHQMPPNSLDHCHLNLLHPSHLPLHAHLVPFLLPSHHQSVQLCRMALST